MRLSEDFMQGHSNYIPKCYRQLHTYMYTFEFITIITPNNELNPIT